MRQTAKIPVIFQITLDIKHIQRQQDFCVVGEIFARFDDADIYIWDFCQAVGEDEACGAAAGDELVVALGGE